MDMEKLQPGLSAEMTTVVDESLVVKHMGGDGVLSTPSMIGLMERAGIQAVQSVLPEGYTTVGFEVHVKHFAPTAKGKKVTVRAELLEVDGRKLRFRVEAHDEDKKIGEGTHRRAAFSHREQVPVRHFPPTPVPAETLGGYDYRVREGPRLLDVV